MQRYPSNQMRSRSAYTTVTTQAQRWRTCMLVDSTACRPTQAAVFRQINSEVPREMPDYHSEFDGPCACPR